jgi:hypothetical protein
VRASSQELGHEAADRYRDKRELHRGGARRLPPWQRRFVYIYRRLLMLTPVPPSFRAIDPSIPPDATIATNIDAIRSSLDVDANGNVDSATDIVYITRRLFHLTPVPPSFRLLDPTIPSDAVIAQRIDALCP